MLKQFQDIDVDTKGQNLANNCSYTHTQQHISHLTFLSCVVLRASCSTVKNFASWIEGDYCFLFSPGTYCVAVFEVVIRSGWTSCPTWIIYLQTVVCHLFACHKMPLNLTHGAFKWRRNLLVVWSGVCWVCDLFKKLSSVAKWILPLFVFVSVRLR